MIEEPELEIELEPELEQIARRFVPMYTRAIVRLPARTCAEGITRGDHGRAEYTQLLQQHLSYTAVLRSLDLEITKLPSLPEFPDAYFVEDVAVVTPEIAVIARPGAEARRGETEHIREALAAFRPLAEIAAPGTLEGGDVLQVERTVFIGLSGRTNEEGAGQLARILQPFGYEVHTLPLRRGLHLKSAVNYLGRNTLLLTREWAEHPLFAAYKKIVVPPQEAYAANTLLVNGRLLAPDGYPETAAMLREAGFEVLELVVSEARKMDGGLTCMSLRL